MNTFPNPAYNEINVYANGITIEKIEVTNINGQVVYDNTINAIDHKIDVSAFNEGIYFVKVSTAKGVQTNKVIVR